MFEHRHWEVPEQSFELEHGVRQLQKMFCQLTQAPSVLRLSKQPNPPVQDPLAHPGDPLRMGPQPAHPLLEHVFPPVAANAGV